MEKCSFSESLDWREGGEEIKQYMEERVHLDWALGEGEDRYRHRQGERRRSYSTWREGSTWTGPWGRERTGT